MALYDAFISYSHSKDKPIAAALQSVVQRLGKPWYRRRALRVFRDDTSLSATPQLWPSIEQALGASQYLILLASPEAAASPWVGKEIAYWLAHKGAETLLLALTDGTLAWDHANNDFHWSGATPLPAVLQGKFRSEPKWVDLSTYRSGAAPRDPRFMDLAADFAAAIRGIPKEDLLSLEVRQQRRALALAWSAAGSLLVLALLAGWQWQLANNQRERAERALDAATGTADTLVFDLAREFRNRSGMPADLVNSILERVVALQRQLARSGSTAELRRLEAVSLNELSDYYVAQGSVAAALDAALRAVAISRALAESHPDQPILQRGLAISLNRLGDVRRSEGNWPEAIEAYRSAVAITETLVALDPDNLTWQRDLWLSYEKVADVQAITGLREEALATYRRSLDAIRALNARKPDESNLQADLAFIHNRIAIVLDAAGRHAEALEAYREASTIHERLAAATPDDTRRQHAVFLSLTRMAGALSALGQHQDAIATYRRAAALMEPFAAGDPGNVRWQQELVDVYDQITKLLADSGERDHMLGVDRRALAARERLVAVNPANVKWQYDLAVSYLKVGHALMAAGRPADASAIYRNTLPIFEMLAAAEPDHQHAQSNLSLGHLSVAEALAALQDWTQARAFYDKSALIRERVAARDPSNLSLQRDQAFVLERRARTLLEMKDLDAALLDHDKALAIRLKVAATAPGHMPYQRELAYSYGITGEALHNRGRKEEAGEKFRSGLAVVEAYATSDPANLMWRMDLVAALLVLAHHGIAPDANYARARSIVQQLEAEGSLTPEVKAQLHAIEQRYGAKP